MSDETVSLEATTAYNEPQRVDNELFRVGSRGRLYTTAEQRDRLGLDGYGHGVELSLIVRTLPFDLGGDFRGCNVATATVTLQAHGEFTLPKPVRGFLGVREGEYVVCSLAPESA